MRLTPTALLLLLRRLEWCYGGDCPECRANLHRGHERGCLMGNVIAAVQERHPAPVYPWAPPQAIPIGRPCNGPKAC